MSVLSKRFGDLGRRLYSTFLGHDLLPVDTVERDHKTMGHGKVMHGETDRNIIRGVMRQLVERLSIRLRRNLKNCNIFYIGYKTRNGWVNKKYKTYPTNSNDRIWSLVQEHFKTWHKQKIYQLQITAISLEPSDR
jgi:DNA polymerase-4